MVHKKIEVEPHLNSMGNITATCSIPYCDWFSIDSIKYKYDEGHTIEIPSTTTAHFVAHRDIKKCDGELKVSFDAFCDAFVNVFDGD